MLLNPWTEWLIRFPEIGSSRQCYEVMYTVARSFRVRRVVEIGTHRGGSAMVFYDAITTNGDEPAIWTIDNYSQGHDPGLCRAMAEEIFRASGADSRIERIIGESKTALPALFKQIGKVDLVFVDGAHDAQSALLDVRNSLSFTDLLLIHDTARPQIHSILRALANEGWTVLNFPTRRLEKGGKPKGIAAALWGEGKPK